MNLSSSHIKQAMAWLLANGSSPVRYLTHINLLGLDSKSTAAEEMWQAVEQSEVVQQIFSQQHPDGSWCAHGPWANKPSYIPKSGYSPFTPKHVTTLWILMILGAMGFRIDDPRIGKACDYVLKHQLPNGMFHRFARTHEIPNWGLKDASELTSAPCELSLYLRALGSVGMVDNHRLGKSYKLLIDWQREDGGWVLHKHLAERFKTRSCPASTHEAAVALYQSCDSEYVTALQKALHFQVWHLSLKDVHKLSKLVFRGHEFLTEMLMFIDLDVGLGERPVDAILNWLMSMYDVKQGHFHYPGRRVEATDLGPAGRKYWLFHRIEDDWLTYHMMRIATKLG